MHNRRSSGRAAALAACAGVFVSLADAVARAEIDTCEFCLGDLNLDGVVGNEDLSILLGDWGDLGDGSSDADFDGSGAVDGRDLARLLGSWGECAVTDAAGPLAIDIDVDTNRDTLINGDDEDGEDRWTKARGAFFLLNVDDDDGDGKPDAIEWGQVPAGAAPPSGDPWDPELFVEDTKINGDTDKADITQVVLRKTGPLPAGTELVLKVGSADEARAMHLFKTIAAGETKVWGGPAEAALEWKLPGDLVTKLKSADVTVGIEGLKLRLVNAAANDPFPNSFPMLFGGFVNLELVARKVAEPTKVCGADKVRLKVAPFIALPNSQESEKVIVLKSTDTPNADFRAHIEAGLPVGQLVTYLEKATAVKAKFKCPDTAMAAVAGSPKLDTQWSQDNVEIGYAETPASKMHLSLYTRHHGDGVNTFVCKNPADSKYKFYGDGHWVREHLLGPGRGIYRSPCPPDFSGGASGWTSQDFGGNIELLPPTGKHPLGRLCVGHTAAAMGSHGMSRQKRVFLESQEVQPVFDLDTSWLAVGHVDEYVSFVKGADADSELTVVVASPKMALADIIGVAPPDSDDPGVLFGKPTSDPDGQLAYEWGVVSQGTPNGFMVDDADFSFGYKYVRIYEGTGAGQTARIAAINGGNVVIDWVWGPFSPNDFLEFEDSSGFLDASAGLDQYAYAPLTSAQWLTVPDRTSKYVLIEDTLFYQSGPSEDGGVADDPGETPAARTIAELKDATKYGSFHDLNWKIHAKIEAALTKLLDQALKPDGAKERVKVVRVPVLYMGKLEGGQPKRCRAWTPGAANIQYGTKPADAKPRSMFVAKQYDFRDGSNPFKTKIAAELAVIPKGKVYWVDDWELYHKLSGEVHCGSNVIRKPYGFSWWTKQPGNVPDAP